jgi:hypothetical protein
MVTAQGGGGWTCGSFASDCGLWSNCELVHTAALSFQGLCWLGPSARRMKDMLKLNTDWLRWVVGLFTGHCHLKGHFIQLRLTYDPTCDRCVEEDGSASHIQCDCEAIAYLRFCHLSQFFMEPSDYYDAPTNNVLHFIRSLILIKG